MPLYNSEAIVLRKVAYRDADRIVTFFTPDQGKLSGLARGAGRLRSRYGSALEILTHGTLIYFDRQGKNLVQINHFDILHSFRKLREDLLRSASCQYLAELVLGLIPERAAAPEAFSFFLKTLEQIGRVSDPEPILRIFEIRFLVLTGFVPRMDACVHCGGDKGPFAFSATQGGVVCSRCRGRNSNVRPLSRGAIRFWEQALVREPEWFDRVRLEGKLNDELRHLLHGIFCGLLGREIRSYNFLTRLRKDVGSLTPSREDDT
jgi:DNA repair protein RecO (recombination protein O)